MKVLAIHFPHCTQPLLMLVNLNLKYCKVDWWIWQVAFLPKWFLFDFWHSVPSKELQHQYLNLSIFFRDGTTVPWLSVLGSDLTITWTMSRLLENSFKNKRGAVWHFSEKSFILETKCFSERIRCFQFWFWSFWFWWWERWYSYASSFYERLLSDDDDDDDDYDDNDGGEISSDLYRAW